MVPSEGVDAVNLTSLLDQSHSLSCGRLCTVLDEGTVGVDE
jgi:hypothetical protein